MNCYFQGCNKKGETKEHIPPRSFFPDGEKQQLLTVKSCKEHNNSKAKDDLYVLAQICMNASPSNRAREVFSKKIVPQLKFNNSALRKRLEKDSVDQGNGIVKYSVDISRFDDFFAALVCGIIFKSCKSPLPNNYKIRHVYHNFERQNDPILEHIKNEIDDFYSSRPMDFMKFGYSDTKNERIYTATIFGIPEFKSSITVVHVFFGKFKVTSMLQRLIKYPN